MSTGSKGKKREVISVKLTGEQRYEMDRLWFYYGNHGPKATPGNHGFIHALLDFGEDQRPLRNRFTTPTPECAAAVDAILASKMPDTPQSALMEAVRTKFIAEYERELSQKADSEIEKGGKK